MNDEKRSLGYNDETGERIYGNAQDLLEVMTATIGRDLATANGGEVDATTLAVRYGVSFLAALMQASVDADQPMGAVAFMQLATREAQRWGIAEKTRVIFAKVGTTVN